MAQFVADGPYNGEEKLAIAIDIGTTFSKLRALARY
jgi:hypothetical protein